MAVAVVTFIGHASFLIQIGGLKLLIDPVFSDRLVLIRRLRRPGILVRALPPIDAVLLTHAHMDHLDMPSLRRIIRHTFRMFDQLKALKRAQHSDEHTMPHRASREPFGMQ